MIKHRPIKRNCPKCHRQRLEAIEVDKRVTSYKCKSCNSIFDAEVYHDFTNRKHYWIGKLRNPKYWNLDNKTLDEGLAILYEREQKGVKAYLGIYVMEEIK